MSHSNDIKQLRSDFNQMLEGLTDLAANVCKLAQKVANIEQNAEESYKRIDHRIDVVDDGISGIWRKLYEIESQMESAIKAGEEDYQNMRELVEYIRKYIRSKVKVLDECDTQTRNKFDALQAHLGIEIRSGTHIVKNEEPEQNQINL